MLSRDTSTVERKGETYTPVVEGQSGETRNTQLLALGQISQLFGCLATVGVVVVHDGDVVPAKLLQQLQQYLKPHGRFTYFFFRSVGLLVDGF